MDISVTANPSRQTAYINTQANAVRTAKKTSMSAPAQAQDEIVISPEAKTTMEQTAQVGTTAPTAADAEKQTSNTTTFASFAEEFSKITQGYSDTIRKYYAEAHDNNLTYDDPAAHIWDKYKNPDSPDFRADLSEDERAWAYDQELDLLSGGKHLQMSNPYVFAFAGCQRQ